MPPDLVLHLHTASDLERFVANPAQALLLIAPEGSGKSFVAQHIAAQLLGPITITQLAAYPHFKIVKPVKNTIPIEAIRDLRQFTKLSISGNQETLQRLIIIEQAHKLTTEAQNALLKLLEEPPTSTALILTASHEQSLLPTIRSRVQVLHVRAPGKTALSEHYAKNEFDSAEIDRAYLVSGGLPGLMHALLTDADHPMLESVTLAREVLRGTQFERLAKVDSLSKAREQSLQMLAVLQRMAQAALIGSAAKSNDDKPLRQWHRVLQASAEAEQALTQNAQAKLVLTNLMLTL